MLTKNQLKQLRKEIVLNSLFLKDYNNSLYIDKKTCYLFFDGYIENLYDMAKNENYKNKDITDIINKYDNIENLYNYYLCFENDPLIKDDYIAYCCDGIYAGMVIYDINDYKVVNASYYIDKYGNMIINKITSNTIYYDNIGDPYIKKYGRRYLLSNFIKKNYGGY